MLLDGIISILADQKGSLEAALLQTKILLRQLGHKELTAWVNNELTGYPEDAEVPLYRTVSGIPHGHVVNFRWQAPDWVLPTGQLTEQQAKIVHETRIGSSIGTLEQQVKTYREEKKGLIRQLPPEFIPAFQNALSAGTNIFSIWVDINMADVEAILVQVRSRLLDFCLEIQEALGDITEAKELQERATTIDTPGMFHTIVYGGTVIFGGTNVQVNNRPGDVNGLLHEVGKLGYDKADLEELRKAVLADKKPSITDGETRKWYMEAVKKIGKGTVKVGADIATNVIIKAIEHYIGR
jgi:hypothetical protein